MGGREELAEHEELQAHQPANTFRYHCNDCDNNFDFVEDQPERVDAVVCPNCNSSSTMSAAQHMDILHLCDWFMMGVSLSVAPVVDLEVEDVQCVVCNERLRATDFTRRMPCGHLYHPDCIFEWFLNRRNSCPVCRFVLPLKTRDPGPPPPPPPAAATT
ncbi:hypothetical protein QJS04_geneDACA009609 [Acorus gramineus]|uniref:RING-type domain-containing protein n=1 Tax=Acorus gramineus TaxID=55184 RepID=A0AAV9BB24_ACOGR|nr:hypothetical protein QJS04_geneDACA009609 [Acorus gramineus]